MVSAASSRSPPLQYQQLQPRVQALCAQYGVPYRQETILARLKKLVGIATGDAHMRVRQERSTTRETDRREVERVAS